MEAEHQPEGGKRVREFQGDDVGQVFRLLARQAKISLAVDPSVTGLVTVRLENTSAMEAIEIVARQSKLSLSKDDNGVYYVTPPDAVNAALDFIANPETANRVAAYKHNLYVALMKEGFAPDDSLKIVTASDPSGAIASLNKRTEPSSPK